MKKLINFLSLSFALVIIAFNSYAAGPDPALVSATVSPAPATYPGGIETFSFIINNNGTSTSSTSVKVTVSFSTLDFDDGTFDLPSDITQTAGTTQFSWSWNSTTKVLTGTLAGTFSNLAGNTFQVNNLKVLAASDITNPTVGANVNIVAPGAVNSSTNNDNVSAYTYTITSPTPVSLFFFGGTAKDCSSILTWKSESELDFSHYEIERSKDGQAYEKIGTVTSRGSNSNYSFTDSKPISGKNYYRLKIVDKDGTFTYSSVIGVNPTCRQITISPTITNDITTVYGLSGNEMVNVYGSNGQLVLKLKATGPQQKVSLARFSHGVYMISVVDNDKSVFTTKVVKGL